MLVRILFTLSLSLSLSVFAQDTIETAALGFFSEGNYKNALPYFVKLLQQKPNDSKLNYYTGVSYLKSSYQGIALSIPYLEKAAAGKRAEPESHFYLGRAYALTLQPDKAERSFSKYLRELEKINGSVTEGKKQLEFCMNLKALMKKPVNVTFENAGAAINSVYNDFTPFISDNESFLIFNSTRGATAEAKKLGNGEFMTDIFISTDVQGKWTNASGIGNMINEPERSEEVVGLAADGKTIVYRYYAPEIGGNLLVGPKEGDRFFPPQQLKAPVNSDKIETAGTLAPDGKTIYFVSDRNEGSGGTDIYRVTKLPNEEWSEAINLGSSVNTEDDENFPFVSADGRKLYFSSRGHNSMGGYDVFVSTWNDSLQSWNKAENLGFPVNGPEDNMSFCISETGRYGYVSSNRADSYGGLDIYRVIFNDVEAKKTLLKGYVASQDGEKVNVPVRLDLFKGNSLVGSYVPNQYTGKYIMILEPGSYRVEVTGEGFKKIKKDLVVYDKSGFEAEKVNEIYLLEKL